MRCVLFLVLLPLLCAASPAEAQDGSTIVGAKVGPTSATVSADVDEATHRLRMGLSAAAFVEFRLTSFMAIQPEIEYVQRGFIEEYDMDPVPPPEADVVDPPEPIQTRYRFDYLSFPILAKVRIPGYQFTPYLMGGPRVDVLVNSQWALEAPTPPPPQTPPNHREQYRSVAAGWTVGLGIIPGFQWNIPVFAEARYYADITDSYDTDETTMRNWGLGLVIGLQF